ncbi:hypothetical protein HPB52_017342 [Rhipicephalus sanguineus]|uniref:Uncharacterized protein n=1 Tax=Rhipicephalus sanguineus TaxID=34632 RepID=A0A9D4YQG3_RHISA|nr:hypothetical protein HPB52_017342 [Rhipicephalus sanguineus]
MDDNADLRQDEDTLASYADQWVDLPGVTDCITAAVFKCRSSYSETPDRPCHIVRHQASLNELLFSVKMQLREIPLACRQLALVSVADSGLHLPEPQDFQSKLGACLMHRLLKCHQCIAAPSVTPFHFEKCASLLCEVLPYSRLKKVTLQFWCSPMCESICATKPSQTSLQELECSFFGDCCAEYPTALAELVRNSPSLVLLGLQGTSMEEQGTNNLLSCLVQSGILKELTLRGSLVPEACREELLKYLTLAPSLASLCFAADSEMTEMAMLEAFLHNKTLSKHRLKKVYVLSDSPNHNLLTHVCHTLEDNGVRDKVFCGVYFAEDNIDLLKYKLFSGLFLVGDVHEDVNTAALLQLPDCGHVTSLVLEISRGNIAVSSALAQYVQSTSVLRKLEVSMGYADDFDFLDERWKVILESLARSNSIKEVVFYVDSMSNRDVGSIADAVNASRNTRKLIFGECTVTCLRASVSRLSLGITVNHTLLGYTSCKDGRTHRRRCLPSTRERAETWACWRLLLRSRRLPYSTGML